MFWKVFFLLHIGYIGFAMPFKISFDFNPTWQDVIIDNYISMVFITDIVIIFFTPLPDKEGKLIYDKKKIALHYVKRWFFIDLTLCFPFSYFRVTSSDEYGEDA